MQHIEKYFRYYLNTALRFTALCWNQPHVLLIFFGVYLSNFLPFVRVNTEKDKVSGLRKERKQNQRNWGWAVGATVFTLHLFGRKILDIPVKDEYRLNLITFFINRNIKLVRKAIREFENAGKTIPFKRGMKIFEPGCNAGRNLYFSRDFYRAEIWGADVYEKSLAIARKADIYKDAHLFNEDLVKSDFLSNFRDDTFDLTVIRSHIVHVAHFERDQREAYYENLQRISQRVLVIEKKTKQVLKFLNRYGFDIIINGDMVFGLRLPFNQKVKDSLTIR